MAVEGVRAAKTGTDDKKGSSPDTGAVVPLDRVTPPRRAWGVYRFARWKPGGWCIRKPQASAMWTAFAKFARIFSWTSM